MHEQVTQIGVSLFANAEQSFFSSRAVLFRREPKRSSHLSAVRKLAGISNRCQQCCCGKRADAAHFLQTHRYRVLSGNLFDLLVELFNTLVKDL